MQFVKKLDKFLEAEQKVIHLMLQHKQVVGELIENKISPDFFSDRHQFLVICCFQEYMDSESSYPRLLTRETYEHRLVHKYGQTGQVLTNLKVFDSCVFKASSTPDDLGTLKIELMNGYAARHAQNSLDRYEKIIQNKGVFLATQELAQDLNQIATVGTRKKSVFVTMKDVKNEYMVEKKEQRENPGKIIKCGIDEFDKVMGVGLAPQTLTFIVADTGVGKTACMLNMGLNIAKKDQNNVLFVSLEMDRFRLIDRIVSNLSGITLDLINQPFKMTEEQFQRVEKSFDQWEIIKGNFAILDTDERITVSILKREIELRSMVYKPHVVIVDYVGIVRPEIRYKDRQDVELGEVTKDLRDLGRKYNFAVVSACQLNREAIRRMRKSKENLAGSEDLRGSGELSNDADYIFALFPTEEGNRLKAQTIKSRHGQVYNTFSLYFDGSRCKVANYDAVHLLPEEKDSDFDDVFSTSPGGSSEIDDDLDFGD